MRQEYSKRDLGAGIRRNHSEQFKEGHNLVLLRPEVAKAFPSEDAVNEELLSLIKIAKASTNQTSQIR